MSEYMVEEAVCESEPQPRGIYVGDHVFAPDQIVATVKATGKSIVIHADGDHGFVADEREVNDERELLVVGWSEGSDGWIPDYLLKYDNSDPHISSLLWWADRYRFINRKKGQSYDVKVETEENLQVWYDNFYQEEE